MTVLLVIGIIWAGLFAMMAKDEVQDWWRSSRARARNRADRRYATRHNHPRGDR